MKNLTKFGMMLLAAALCVGMSSCSDDDDNDGGTGGSSSFASNNPLISEGKKLLTKIVITRSFNDYGSDSFMNDIMYDSHFRPIKFTSDNKWGEGEKQYIDYETGIIYEDEEADGKFTFTPQGYIKGYLYSSEEYEEQLWTYNSEGHLTKTEWTDGCTHFRVTSLVWKEGNLVKSKRFDKETNDGINIEEWYECTIDYYNKENRFRQIPFGFSRALKLDLDDEMASVGLYGIGPKKLPKKVVVDDGVTYTFEYILNADGSIRQETVTENDDSDGYNYTETCSYSYTPIE